MKRMESAWLRKKNNHGDVRRMIIQNLQRVDVRVRGKEITEKLQRNFE